MTNTGGDFSTLFDVLKCLLIGGGPFKLDSFLHQRIDWNQFCLKVFDEGTQKVYHSTKGTTIPQSLWGSDCIDCIDAGLARSNAWPSILYEYVVSHVDKLGSEKLALFWRDFQTVLDENAKQSDQFSDVILPFAMNQTIIHNGNVMFSGQYFIQDFCDEILPNGR